MAILGLELPRGRALTGAVLYGVFTFGGAFALAYYALVRLHAGFGQTLLALVPLATLLLLVAVQRQERMRIGAVVGALLALSGVALMARAPFRESAPLLSLLAAVGAAFCFAQGALLVRRFPRDDEPVSAGLVIGGLLVLAGVYVGALRPARAPETIPGSSSRSDPST
jgi:drug/metabolite transporter (DMT)-like permease